MAVPDYFGGGALLHHKFRVGDSEPTGNEVLDAAMLVIAPELLNTLNDNRPTGNRTVADALLLLWEGVQNVEQMWKRAWKQMVHDGLCEEAPVRRLGIFESVDTRVKNGDMVKQLELQLTDVLSGDIDADARTSLILSLMYAQCWRYLIECPGNKVTLGDFRIRATPTRRQVVEAAVKADPLGQTLCSAILVIHRVKGRAFELSSGGF